jgi:hypothetical protein
MGALLQYELDAHPSRHVIARNDLCFAYAAHIEDMACAGLWAARVPSSGSG